MKWLATVLGLLAIQATASEYPTYEPDFNAEHPFEVENEVPRIPNVPNPDTRSRVLPLFLQCSPVAPDAMLEERYGELGMLDGEGSVFISPGQVLKGSFRMFVNPTDKTYTVILQIGDDLHCMVISGEHLGPMVSGDKI